MSRPSDVGIGSFAAPTFDTSTFNAASFGLSTELVDGDRYQRSVDRFRERSVLLPTFTQLADPSRIPDGIRSAMAGVDRNAADPLNLFRVHWYNDLHGGFTDVPEHAVSYTHLTVPPLSPL